MSRFIRSMKLLTNPPDCTILDTCAFENFILADKPFAKALRIFETCVLPNNNLREKLAYHSNFQSNLMKDLQLLQFHFLLQILGY